jgi:hypothetical protein
MGMHRFFALLAAATLLVHTSCLYQKKETLHGLETPTETAGPEHAPPAITVITNLAGPESVLYDRDQDAYFISNINGGLLVPDNNGFITRVDAQTLKVEPKWIAAGTNGVHLDAPKGMAVAGNSLYVSDITGVRKFDRRTGAPQGEIALPGATLINDLTTDGTNVYASDTGVKPSSGITFEATGTDAIWKIANDRATKIASGTGLDQPNGVEWFGGNLWVASFRGNEIYRLDGNKKADAEEVPRGQLDGLVHLADGTPLVTSWIGKAVYRGTKKGEFVAVLRGISAPADIGYDTKRGRLLVPNSPMNQVTIHGLR